MTPTRRGRSGRAVVRSAVVTLALVATGSGVALTSASADDSTSSRTSAAARGPVASTGPVPVAAPGTIRLTQANLLSGQAVPKFQADVSAVQATAPDFITYNEVPYRNDAVLAPAPYQIWRTPGEYTGATPVAWNADKWTMVNEGTTMVSNKKGRDPGQSVDWGIRYANWVTLQGIDGHMISIISAHLAPESDHTRGLVTPSLNNLGELAATLSASGPVLMAGDFNFNYGSAAAYPRDQLTALGFTPTYDVLGWYPPTGDHYGATIDYVFMRSSAQFVVQNQYTTELNSDHDALTADLAFTDAPVDAPVTFASGALSNNPDGDRAAKRAVLDLLVRAVDNAPKRAAIHLSTGQLSDKKLFESLLEAKKRGAHVQVVTFAPRLNSRERELMAKLGTRVHRKSWGVTCATICQRMVAGKRVPVTRLLVSQSGATPALRIDVDQAASWDAGHKPTHAEISTSEGKYDSAFKKFFRLVGLHV